MESQNILWEQRFSNFEKAFAKLEEAIEYFRSTEINSQNTDAKITNEILKEGLIQRFEYTHELAWNVMKDYANFQGNPEIAGSRDSTRESFKLQLIEEADIWMDMIRSRNQTSHTYNKEVADDIFTKIMNQYYPAFLNFRNKMIEKRLEK